MNTKKERQYIGVIFHILFSAQTRLPRGLYFLWSDGFDFLFVFFNIITSELYSITNPRACVSPGMNRCIQVMNCNITRSDSYRGAESQW